MIKTTKLSLILLIAAITVILGYFVSLPKNQVQPEDNRPVEEVNNATSSEPVVVATSTKNWLTYRNEEYGFEFQYPKTWTYNKGEYVSFHPSSQKDCTLNTGRTVKESSCSEEIFLFIEPNDKKLSLGEFFRDKGRWKKGEDYEDIKEFTIGNIIVYKVTLISAYDGSRLESFWAPLSDEKFLELKEFLPKENKSVFNQMISTFKLIK